jgi:hypothetical protein
MSLRKFLGVLLLYSSVFTISSTTRATTLVPLSVDDLTQECDLIVVGKTLSIAPADRTFSYAVFSVSENWKGSPGQSVTLKILGGQTDDNPAGIRVPGAPSFVPGWNYVLFLTARPEEGGRFFNVTGWTQGRYEISKDGILAGVRPLADLKREVVEHLRHPRPKRLGGRAAVKGDTGRSIGGGFHPLPIRNNPSLKPSPLIRDDSVFSGGGTLTQEEIRKRDEKSREGLQ